MDKPITWMGNSKATIKKFSDQARRNTGFQLRRVQQGSLPHDWKPMTIIGSGVAEIRIHIPYEHRVLYVAKFEESVYVLHAFEKKKQKTPRRDIEIAKKMYENLLRLRIKVSV